MKLIEQFAELLTDNNRDNWGQRIIKLGNELGYEQTMLALLPERNASLTSEFACKQGNYSSVWIEKYIKEDMWCIDPTVSHGATKSIPLIWTPEAFATRQQKEMYEEACSYGIRAGISLPIHGSDGELGLLSFVNDVKADKNFAREAIHNMPTLSCLRDYAFESSRQFTNRTTSAEETVLLSPRELECLKWSVAGKGSWEIGEILNISKDGIDFHFKNIRRKFRTSTRQQAAIKAIRMGLINPA